MNKIIQECIDLDEWKHSWHNSLESKEDYGRAKGVLVEKLGQRLDDIQRIRAAIVEAERMIGLYDSEND